MTYMAWQAFFSQAQTFQAINCVTGCVVITLIGYFKNLLYQDMYDYSTEQATIVGSEHTDLRQIDNEERLRLHTAKRCDIHLLNIKK